MCRPTKLYAAEFELSVIHEDVDGWAPKSKIPSVKIFIREPIYLQFQTCEFDDVYVIQFKCQKISSVGDPFSEQALFPAQIAIPAEMSHHPTVIGAGARCMFRSKLHLVSKDFEQ
jgi:hypothetical protein